MVSIYKRFVGLALIASMTTFRSIVWHNYSLGTINVWQWALTYLTLLPIDGIISGLYGVWSRDRLAAFTIGTLPSIISLIFPITQIHTSWQALSRSIFFYGGLAIGMGLMGLGLAEWKVDRKRFGLGVAIWFSTLILGITTGMD